MGIAKFKIVGAYRSRGNALTTSGLRAMIRKSRPSVHGVQTLYRTAPGHAAKGLNQAGINRLSRGSGARCRIVSRGMALSLDLVTLVACRLCRRVSLVGLVVSYEVAGIYRAGVCGGIYAATTPQFLLHLFAGFAILARCREV